MLEVGQRVRVKEFEQSYPDELFLVGQEGFVIEVDMFWSMPYEVQFDNKDVQAQNEFLGIRLFKEDELEVIE